MRPNSASQNLRSNDALCATIGASPTKRLAAAIISSAGGASSIISLPMPVYASMNAGMRTPAFISDWKRSTTLPSSTRAMATSVARSPIAGERPVVSKSMTAMGGKVRGVYGLTILPIRWPFASAGPRNFTEDTQ
jgi:hypothetical protein